MLNSIGACGKALVVQGPVSAGSLVLKFMLQGFNKGNLEAEMMLCPDFEVGLEPEEHGPGPAALVIHCATGDKKEQALLWILTPNPTK